MIYNVVLVSAVQHSESVISVIHTHILLFFLWLFWVFVAARGLSLAAASGGYSSLWFSSFSLQWLLLLQSSGSRRAGSVVVAHRS